MAADSVIGMDGTSEPAPPPLLSDPLAGLVTGSSYQPRITDEVRVARPAMPELPDPEEIRRALEAVLAEETPRRTVHRPAPISGVPGIVPRQPRQWPSHAAMLARRLRATRDEPAPQSPPPARKSAGMPSGVTVAVIIVTVLAVLFYLVIRGLVDTFARIFG